MPDFAGEKIRITPEIGCQLQRAREKLNLTQMQVAQAVDASQPQIDQYEHGNLDMPVDRLFDLATLLNIQIQDLFKNES